VNAGQWCESTRGWASQFGISCGLWNDVLDIVAPKSESQFALAWPAI